MEKEEGGGMLRIRTLHFYYIIIHITSNTYMNNIWIIIKLLCIAWEGLISMPMIWEMWLFSCVYMYMYLLLHTYCDPPTFHGSLDSVSRFTFESEFFFSKIWEWKSQRTNNVTIYYLRGWISRIWNMKHASL